MINKLRGMITRANVNHPRKVAATAPNAFTAALIPLDGGITFCASMLVSSVWSLASVIGSGGDEFFLHPSAEDPEDYEKKSTITHLNKTYEAVLAQSNVYDGLERKIQSLKQEFNSATEKRQKQILKKAQSLADKQQWIVEGLKEVPKVNSEDRPKAEFKIDRTRLVRKLKVGMN